MLFGMTVLTEGQCVDPADFMGKLAASRATYQAAFDAGTFTAMDLMAIQEIIIGIVHTISGTVDFDRTE